MVFVYEVLCEAVTIIIVNRNTRTIDGELFKVRPTVTVELGVEVGVDAALQERVVGEINAADDVARLELGDMLDL